MDVYDDAPPPFCCPLFENADVELDVDVGVDLDTDVDTGVDVGVGRPPLDDELEVEFSVFSLQK